MIRVALFDVDGVVIRKHEYFSELLAREYNIPIEEVIGFFKNEFKLCSLGKADLKEEIVKYFEKWKWKKSADELLKIWFENEKEVDQEVLLFVGGLRKKGIKCFLATNQEKYRLKYLFEEIGLKEHFDGAFASCELGRTKSDKEFYDLIVEKLGNIQSEEIIFWDSDKKIAETANNLGIVGRLYTGSKDLKI